MNESWLMYLVRRQVVHETLREFLLVLLRATFPDQVSPEMVETIEQENSEEALQKWYDEALRMNVAKWRMNPVNTASFEEFAAMLRRDHHPGPSR
jgi:hypothetical protein